jgi:uracil-DNA glycosylase
LLRELKLLKPMVVVVLGRIALDSYLQAVGEKPSRFTFAHDLLHEGLSPPVLCSYHPSQQNTSTGRLTQAMLDEVFERAAEIIRCEATPTALLP